MATTTTHRKGMTDEQRAEKRARERERMTQAIEELRSSEGWQTWLTARQRFHRYSFGNQLLIAHQHPTATNVAGFHHWLKLGYVVRKGEHALYIWAPLPPSKRRMAEWEETRAHASADAGVDLDGERPRTFFKMVPVFAQDQVEELPPPAEPVPLSPPITDISGDSLAPVWAPLVTLAASVGSTVTVQTIDRGHGYYTLGDKSIVISDTISVNQQIKTLVHEISHALVRADRQKDDPEFTYAQEELVAESVAFSVTGTLGLDTTGYSIPYLAVYASSDPELKTLEATARLVNRLAVRIENAIPETLGASCPA